MNRKNEIENKDITDIIKQLFESKKIIISITVFSALLSVFISLTLPNLYKSEALLAPSSVDNSVSSKFSGYSSLTNLAGISLPDEGITLSQEALARIKTYSFFLNHFIPNIRLQDLMAVLKWDSENNSILYDNSVYDSENQTWLKDGEPNSPPSSQEAFEIYKSIIEIEEKTNSLVIISLEHKSPYVSKEWIEVIIENINKSMKERAQDKAQRSINFLNDYANNTSVQALKDTTSNLMEDQMKKLMLAASSSDFVFRVLDEPIVAEKKSRPTRSLICILGTILGFMFSCFYVLFRDYFHFINIKNS